MARSSSPWFRKDRGYWCVYHEGRLVKLAEGKHNRKAALKAFHALMNGDSLKPKGDPTTTIKELAREFVKAMRPELKPRTVAGYDEYLKRYTTANPLTQAGSLTPKAVMDFMATKDWGPTSRFHFVTVIKRLFAWAKENELIPDNPIREMKRPRPVTRVVIPTKDDAEKLIRESGSKTLRLILEFMYECGCRTDEAMRIERRHLVLESRVAVFPPDEHKTGRKTGEPRAIYLSDRACRIVAELADQNKSGPLFRNNRGTPWNADTLARAVARARKKLGLKDITAYGLRHRWITDGMLKHSSGVVAEMAGHKSTAMIEKVYGHVGQHADILRKIAKDLRE